MSKGTERVTEAFFRRQPAKGSMVGERFECGRNRTRRCSTDGRVFMSYRLPIAKWHAGKLYLVERHRAWSVTSRSHWDSIWREAKFTRKIPITFKREIRP